MVGETPFVQSDASVAEETLQGDTEASINNMELIQVIGLQSAEERFIIDILNVREIVRFSELEITRVAHSHAYVLGVVNLRGKVVPVVDLGRRLGLSVRKRDSRSRVIVVEIDDRIVGFTVDAVSEVLRLSEGTIEPVMDREDYIAGVATVNDQIMTFLDLEKLLFVSSAMVDVQ